MFFRKTVFLGLVLLLSWPTLAQTEEVYLVFDPERDSKSKALPDQCTEEGLAFRLKYKEDDSRTETFYFKDNAPVDTLSFERFQQLKPTTLLKARKWEIEIRREWIEEDTDKPSMRLPLTINEVYKAVYILVPMAEGYLRYKVRWHDPIK